MLHDDDSLDRSLSSGRFDRADHGKSEQKDRQRTEKTELKKLQRQLLRQQVKKGSEPVKTRALEEDIARDIKNADEKTDAEKLIDDAERQEDAEEAAGVEDEKDLL